MFKFSFSATEDGNSVSFVFTRLLFVVLSLFLVKGA